MCIRHTSGRDGGMLSRQQAEDILRALGTLPPEKVGEVHDFVLFLKERYGQEGAVDASEAWADEDLRDLAGTVLTYADRTIWTEAE